MIQNNILMQEKFVLIMYKKNIISSGNFKQLQKDLNFFFDDDLIKSKGRLRDFQYYRQNIINLQNLK